MGAVEVPKDVAGDAVALHALPHGTIPPECMRLFWSWPKPIEVNDETDARRVIATILSEGNADDWRRLDIAALAPIVDELPLFGGASKMWSALCKEAADMRSRRDLVLDDGQRRVLRAAAQVLPELGFELAGGTALAAAYLGHRRSEDLDFFSLGGPVRDAVRAFVKACEQDNLPVKRSDKDEQPSFTRLWVAGVKVEVGRDSPFRLAKSRTVIEGMPVRSLRDLAADKTLALFGRAATRDFVDVYMLQSRYGLDRLMELAKQKDPGFSRDWFAKALQQVERADPADVAMLTPLDFDRMKTDFLRDAQRLVQAEVDLDDPDI